MLYSRRQGISTMGGAAGDLDRISDMIPDDLLHDGWALMT
jgi:hypothetical protein